MLSLDYRSQESLVRYWSSQTIDFAQTMKDTSLINPIAQLQSLLGGLKRDRRVLFVGDKSSGKSSLLAGVMKMPFMAQYPFSEPCVRWRYSCRDADSSFSRFVSEYALLGLELVDTQALELEGQAEFVLSMVDDRTDVLVAVVDARHADDSHVWSLLDALPAEWSGHCVVAVTHTDLMAAQDSLELKSKLRERCHQHEGHAVAIYFVPALADSRTVEVFATRLEETLNSPEGHRSAIRRLSQVCDALLHAQAQVLTSRESMQRSDYGFVDSIDKEIDLLQEAQSGGLDGAIDFYLGVAKEVMPNFIQFVWRLVRSCATPSGLLQLDCLPEATELYYYQSLCQELEARQQDADQQLVLTCESHWKDVRPRMQKILGCDIQDFERSKLNHDLALLRKRFMRCIYDVFMENRLRCQFSEILLSRLSWLRWCFMMLCILVVLAGIMGSLGFGMCACVCLVVAGLSWLIALGQLYRVTRKIRHGMQLAIEELLTKLRVALQQPMSEFIIMRVAAYRRMYVLPRKTLSEQAATLRPMLQRHSELQRQLRALDPYL